MVGGFGTDELRQAAAINLTLTDTQLTGVGTDTLLAFERASLAGTSSQNDLDASAFTGAVTLDGGDGGDTLAGASGSDSLVGGNFSDNLEQTSDAASQVLNDTLITGDGNDTLSAIENPTLTGGASGNSINAAAFTLGGVRIAALGGNDTLAGPAGEDDSLDGGANTDRIAQAIDANQTLTDSQLQTASGLNTDTLASIEQAALTGGASGNSIGAAGFGGSVTLTGLGGDDFMLGASGSDSLDFGTEATATGDSTSQSVDSDQTLTDVVLTGLGTDTIADLETASLFGGGDPNDLDASAFSGRVDLAPGGGNDTLAGAAGNDTLEGSSGTDRVEQTADANQTLTNSGLTGDGNDFLDQIEQASLTGGGSANNITASAFTGGPVTLTGLGGTDTLTGSAAADSLDAGSEADSLVGGGSNDTLSGGSNSDVINGAAGADLLVETQDANMTLTDTAMTGAANDTLDGQIESASLTGGASANTLDASAFSLGQVSLDGAGGADSVVGSAQADSLRGGTEDDVLQGRGGVDAWTAGLAPTQPTTPTIRVVRQSRRTSPPAR